MAETEGPAQPRHNCPSCGARLGPEDASCPSCGARLASRARIPFANNVPMLKSAVRKLWRGQANPAVSRGLPANPVLRDILLGVLLALFVAVLLLVVAYAFLALRGTFSNP